MYFFKWKLRRFFTRFCSRLTLNQPCLMCNRLCKTKYYLLFVPIYHLQINLRKNPDVLGIFPYNLLTVPPHRFSFPCVEGPGVCRLTVQLTCLREAIDPARPPLSRYSTRNTCLHYKKAPLKPNSQSKLNHIPNR